MVDKELLNDIAEKSIYTEGVARNTMMYCCKIFMDNMKPGSVLELGPAEGLMTEVIYENFEKFSKWSNNAVYSIVEGGHAFAEELKKKYPEMDITEAFFEDYIPSQKYTNIILGHVLEHVDDPVKILKLCREWIEEEGRVLVAVPNAKSIHRQAAVKMNLLESIYDFSEKDRRHGHQRVFDFDTLCATFDEAALQIIKRGGYWLKPLSDGQINASWTKEMIDAFLELGETYPEIAGEIYVIASK